MWGVAHSGGGGGGYVLLLCIHTHSSKLIHVILHLKAPFEYCQLWPAVTCLWPAVFDVLRSPEFGSGQVWDSARHADGTNKQTRCVDPG